MNNSVLPDVDIRQPDGFPLYGPRVRWISNPIRLLALQKMDGFRAARGQPAKYEVQIARLLQADLSPNVGRYYPAGVPSDVESDRERQATARQFLDEWLASRPPASRPATIQSGSNQSQPNEPAPAVSPQNGDHQAPPAAPIDPQPAWAVDEAEQQCVDPLPPDTSQTVCTDWPPFPQPDCQATSEPATGLPRIIDSLAAPSPLDVAMQALAAATERLGAATKTHHQAAEQLRAADTAHREAKEAHREATKKHREATKLLRAATKSPRLTGTSRRNDAIPAKRRRAEPMSGPTLGPPPIIPSFQATEHGQPALTDNSPSLCLSVPPSLSPPPAIVVTLAPPPLASHADLDKWLAKPEIGDSITVAHTPSGPATDPEQSRRGLSRSATPSLCSSAPTPPAPRGIPRPDARSRSNRHPPIATARIAAITALVALLIAGAAWIFWPLRNGDTATTDTRTEARVGGSIDFVNDTAPIDNQFPSTTANLGKNPLARRSFASPSPDAKK